MVPNHVETKALVLHSERAEGGIQRDTASTVAPHAQKDDCILTAIGQTKASRARVQASAASRKHSTFDALHSIPSGTIRLVSRVEELSV